ncbi:MAG: molybdopterin-guanine dinucleotide biosynthesis protein A [Alphaproteobacteria bacterium]|nr:molybdopterin-guanine dinucleotide biosynthesis protein A [Alphaproteobacteria bacterium]MCB9929582.1 molybdopterin-guanine dinucleotide biosynthesis protein A [Alphaproteobacteria bacterium]
MRPSFLLAIFVVFVAAAGVARAEDQHVGYYYPPPDVMEDYEARAPLLDGNSRSRRLTFIDGIIKEIASRPYPPTYAIFAKGAEAEKLIIVGVRDGFYDTIYRTRALMAAMTALTRATPLFQDIDPDQHYTFFDLCYMLGFKQLTITNGREFAHQIHFVAPKLEAAK